MIAAVILSAGESSRMGRPKALLPIGGQTFIEKIVGAQSLDELHKQALKEGGPLNFYGTLAQINAEKILPVFEKRFRESM